MNNEIHEILSGLNNYFDEKGEDEGNDANAFHSTSPPVDKEYYSYNYHEELWFMHSDHYANNAKYKINYFFWNGEYKKAYDCCLELLFTSSSSSLKEGDKRIKREDIDMTIQCALKINDIDSAIRLLDMIDDHLEDPSIYWLKYNVYNRAGLKEQAENAFEKFSTSRYTTSTLSMQ